MQALSAADWPGELLRPVRVDVFGELAQRAEDAPVLLAVGAQRHPVLLGHHQRDLENIDRIEPEPLAVQRGIRVELARRNLEVERRDDQARELVAERSQAGVAGGLSERRDFVGHGCSQRPVLPILYKVAARDQERQASEESYEQT